jgi:hypothetical protein
MLFYIHIIIYEQNRGLLQEYFSKFCLCPISLQEPGLFHGENRYRKLISVKISDFLLNYGLNEQIFDFHTSKLKFCNRIHYGTL